MTLADARVFCFRKHVCQYNIVQENCTTLGSMTELQNAAKAAATRPRIQPAEEGDDRPLSVSTRLGRLQFHQSGKFRVLQLADIQDGPKVSKDTVKLIEASLDATRPDIVIFTGNQIAGYDPAYAQTTRKTSLERCRGDFLQNRFIQVFRSVRTVRSCAGTHLRIRARHCRTARASACRSRHSVGGDIRQPRFSMRAQQCGNRKHLQGISRMREP